LPQQNGLNFLHIVWEHVRFLMNVHRITGVNILCAAVMAAAAPAFADSPKSAKAVTQSTVEEVPVFVTGSLIPKRIKLRRIGTKTTSPVRIIDRSEIDQTGRQTTSGVLVDDPSVNVLSR
jgi:hypothetical protein